MENEEKNEKQKELDKIILQSNNENVIMLYDRVNKTENKKINDGLLKNEI